MLPDPPYVKLLLAAKATLDLVDFVTDAGASAEMTVRHGRMRHSVGSEVDAGCLSIVFVGDDSRQDDRNLNAWESVRLLEIDLVYASAIATEISGGDPTGWGLPGRVLAAAQSALQDPASPLAAISDFVTPGSVDPDEKSTEDTARLARGVTVVYRTRSDDSNVLLAEGEDG